MGYTDARRMVGGVLNRICWIHKGTGAIASKVERTISLISTISAI